MSSELRLHVSKQYRQRGIWSELFQSLWSSGVPVVSNILFFSLIGCGLSVGLLPLASWNMLAGIIYCLALGSFSGYYLRRYRHRCWYYLPAIGVGCSICLRNPYQIFSRDLLYDTSIGLALFLNICSYLGYAVALPPLQLVTTRLTFWSPFLQRTDAEPPEDESA